MSLRASIPPSVKNLFPKRAYGHRVARAWKPVGDERRPAPSGAEGWAGVDKPATAAVVRALDEQGYTWINLQANGAANPFRDVRISDLG